MRTFPVALRASFPRFGFARQLPILRPIQAVKKKINKRLTSRLEKRKNTPKFETCDLNNQRNRQGFMTTMKPTLSQLIVALVGMAVVSAPLAQADTVIYNNSTTSIGTFVSPNSLVNGTFSTEFGNQIFLAGTQQRTVTDFKFQYFLKSGSGDETARLRIYANDGPVVAGSSSPGTLLYDSTPVPILNANSAVFDAQPPAGLVVPSTVTWTVSFGGVQTSTTGGETNEVVGLLPYGPPTTGLAFNDMWVNIGGTWGVQSLAGGATATFAAQVSAVPEPTVVQFGLVAGLAGLGMLGLRRRTSK